MWSIFIFIVITFFAARLALKNYKRIFDNIRLGQSEPPLRNKSQRIRNVVLIALGQKKMFKLWKPALLHIFIYVAFLLTQIELIEIVLDGIFHQHRIFAYSLGGFYTFLISFIEMLSFLALVATIIFLWRRNVLKLKRFQNPEMKSWPTRDANYILIGELVLVLAIFLMNGSEQVLLQKDITFQSHAGKFAISSWAGPLFLDHYSIGTLKFLERAGWWMHYLVVLGFLNYLPYSKHLHILFAFPNTYFAKLQPRGEMENIPVIMNEVKSMLGLDSGPSKEATTTDVPEFGAKDIFDLPRRTLLGAYSCTECGRCTAVCPANITGKKLSPRKIMMDIRDRMEEVGLNLSTGKYNKDNYDDGKSLFDYITPEELHSCTTCNACVEACPVLINPLEPILELRRNEILSQSKGPQNWLSMFNSLENNGCVWPMSESRTSWTS
ncbi:MAG: (Fe-S)-binding protein [Saprospiraceae bacterium]